MIQEDKKMYKTPFLLIATLAMAGISCLPIGPPGEGRSAGADLLRNTPQGTVFLRGM